MDIYQTMAFIGFVVLIFQIGAAYQRLKTKLLEKNVRKDKNRHKNNRPA